jgi:uncharacterized membrane protein
VGPVRGFVAVGSTLFELQGGYTSRWHYNLIIAIISAIYGNIYYKLYRNIYPYSSIILLNLLN